MSVVKKTLIIGGFVFSTALFTFLFIEAGNRFFPREDVPTLDEGRIIAENWIKNYSSLYPLYGRDIKLLNQEEIGRGEYRFTFSFNTVRPEYGTHKNEIIVETKHTEIVYAITNNIYDEIAGKYIEDEETIYVYFVVKEENEEGDIERKIDSIEREVSLSVLENIKETSLKELLKGPSDQERQGGYSTHISEGTELVLLRTEGEVAYVGLTIDFNDQSDIAKKQIEKTLSQFEEITTARSSQEVVRVVVRVENVPDDFWFGEMLEEGDERIDVKYLQKVLNADPETMIVDEGVGSPGEESNQFCKKTRDAVASFQRKYRSEVLAPVGLILSTGIVNESTRDKLNAILQQNRL